MQVQEGSEKKNVLTQEVSIFGDSWGMTAWWLETDAAGVQLSNEAKPNEEMTNIVLDAGRERTRQRRETSKPKNEKHCQVIVCWNSKQFPNSFQKRRGIKELNKGGSSIKTVNVNNWGTVS